MRKVFHLVSFILMAVMLFLPSVIAHAAVYDAGTAEELYSLITQGKDPVSNSDIAPTDTIRLTANITLTPTQSNYQAIGNLIIPAYAQRTLDLNGHTLTKTSDETKGLVSLFYLSDRSVLNIMDSGIGGKIICNRTITDNGNYLCSVFCNVPGTSIYNIGASEINMYGGDLRTTFNNSASSHSSLIIGQYGPYTYYSQQAGEKVTDYTVGHKFTLNMYGGTVSDYNNYLFGKERIDGVDRNIYTTSSGFFTLNMYEGTIGSSNTVSTHVGLNYGWNSVQAPGNFRNARIYGLSFIDQQSHDSFFNHLDSNIKIYINSVQTPVSTCLSTANNAYAHRLVELRYEPDLTVANIQVTRYNCNDILTGNVKVWFDYATNTLHLDKRYDAEPYYIPGSIDYKDFDLRIQVDGGKYWNIARINGQNGDLHLTSSYYALTEEDGASIKIDASPNTGINIGDNNRLVVSNRLRLLVNNDANSNHSSAIKCHDMWVNNSWFDAKGTTPVVDCTYGSVVNAHIKVGSFKNNDIIQVEPDLQSYIVSVVESEGGEVTPDSYGIVGVTYNGNTTNYTYNEGGSVQMTATPNSGYHFLRWSNGVTDNPFTLTITQDTVLCALFEADEVINYYDIQVVSEDETMGTVSGGGTHIEEGQTVTITATPNKGYEFLYWTTADGQVQGAISQWTVTQDETLIAHFRVQPPADAISLWVCGTQVTGSNSADILGDGVWCYDHETHTLTVMKDATYNLTNSEFISDFVSGVGTLTINVGNHKLEATCTTTDEVIRTAIWGPNIIFTGTTYHGMTFTAQNMYPANVETLTVTGHMDLTINLKNTTEFGKKWFATAVLLGSVTPSIIVDGANLYINSGVGESASLGYKVTNKTDQAANLSMNNASIQWGSISDKSLGILDDSPKYEINYLTPALESLCLTSAFGLSFFEGTHFNLYAYPAEGYKFVSWSDGNTDNPRLIIMPAHDVYLDPIVEIDNSQTPKGAIINASATEGQGTITNFTSGWYAEGTELTITAVAADGYEFVQWSDGNTANPYFLTVEDRKNISITAVFRPIGEGIEQPTSDSSLKGRGKKLIKDGQLLIERNGKTYNALGAEVK